MSYQVLARKWRPKSFHDLAGQEHVLQTLSHALDNARLHHAYLFTGTRGVGKTTIARILAKCLNCEEGVSSRPCGVCNACTEIDSGRFIDLIEVDAASRTRVEDTRELLDNVQYAPGKGRFKVYLIDEVHMLSTHSFNALLKTLEEPPPHVKFLLATTDPQKLPVTILSRCLQFSLKNLSPALIVEYLKGVLAAEQIEYDESALWHLGSAANGSMRDALTLLDQAISFGEGEVREATVSALLGTPDQKVVLRFAELVRDRDAQGVLAEVAHVAEHNPDYHTLLQHLTSTFHRLAVAQVAPRAADNSLGDRKQLLALARGLAAEDVQLYYQICLNALRDMALAPDRRMAFEMSLLRMIAFSPDEFGRRVSAPPETAAGEPAIDEHSEPETDSAEASGVAANADADSVPAKHSAGFPNLPEVSDRPDARESERPDPVVSGVKKKPDTIGLETVSPRNWYLVTDAVTLGGIAGNVLANCSLEQCVADEVTLILDEQQSALYREEHRELIAVALSDYFGQAVKVIIRIGTSGMESPAARRQRRRREQAEKALADFSNDPTVCDLLDRFSAKILPDSVQFTGNPD